MAVAACVVAGAVAGAVALIAARDARAALRIALDLWLAAGLLRLALPSGTGELAAVAAILAVRQLLQAVLRRTAAGRRDQGPQQNG